MKLATLKNNMRDVQLVVVNLTLDKAVVEADIVLTLQDGLDNWHDISPKLEIVYNALNKGEINNTIAF